jgi:hypothetical protein
MWDPEEFDIVEFSVKVVYSRTVTNIATITFYLRLVLFRFPNDENPIVGTGQLPQQ